MTTTDPAPTSGKPGRMRAIIVPEPGGPEQLIASHDIPPEPGPGEVRIAVRLASCNFMDVLGRRGDYPVPINYPWIPGAEGMGMVDRVGPAVDRFEVGDRIAFIGTGSYSEYAIAKAGSCFALTDGLSDEQAAAWPIQGLTAWHILHTAGRIAKGEWVVIHAAAGGVGGLAIQLAKLAGLTVIATASSNDKLEFCKSLGADFGVNYAEDDFMREVRRLTEGRGVDLVLDSVGTETIRVNFRILSHFGRVVTYGLASGMPEVSVAKDLFPKSLGIQAFSLYNVLAKPHLLHQSAHELVRLIEAGAVDIHIDTVLPLEQAREAHERLESRGTKGKVLLKV